MYGLQNDRKGIMKFWDLNNKYDDRIEVSLFYFEDSYKYLGSCNDIALYFTPAFIIDINLDS